MKIIMIPYAGNVGFAFKQWKKFETGRLKIAMTDFDGRGSRFRYKASEHWNDVVTSTYIQVLEQIQDDNDYVLFGHSMGSSIAYEVYYRLLEGDKRLPCHMIFSGTECFNKKFEKVSQLDEKSFRDYFIDLGGIDQEVLENEELSGYVFGMMRKDAILLEQYEYIPHKTNIMCPVTILNGAKDKKSTKEEWDELMGKKTAYYTFPGDHFFLFSSKNEVFEQVNKTVLERMYNV